MAHRFVTAIRATGAGFTFAPCRDGWPAGHPAESRGRRPRRRGRSRPRLAPGGLSDSAVASAGAPAAFEPDRHYSPARPANCRRQSLVCWRLRESGCASAVALTTAGHGAWRSLGSPAAASSSCSRRRRRLSALNCQAQRRDHRSGTRARDDRAPSPPDRLPRDPMASLLRP
jgi:hypothetical protein